MTNTVLPRNENSPASGLRLEFHALLPGSTRPGERLRAGLPFTLWTVVGVVERLTEESPRSTKDTRAGLNRYTTRMLPPGWPPSWSLTGSISRQSYFGPPAATIAVVSL